MKWFNINPTIVLKRLHSHILSTFFRKVSLWSFLALLIFIIPSCSTQNEPPEKLINEETYLNLMIELQLLRSYQAQSRADSTTIDSLMRAVFKKYDVTAKQFKKSHHYYQGRIEQQTARIDSAIDRLRKDRIRELTSSDSSTTNRDK